jgi:phosphate-selective porin OprO/OprP
MNRRLVKLAVLMLSATSAIALGGPAFAAASTNTSTDDRLRALEDELATVNAQLGDLKRSQSDQYGDVNRQFGALPVVKLDNGRPTIATADGNFTLAIRSLVQFDTGYYAQGAAPLGTDFSSGSNFRRARLGISGTLFTDWSYEFIYDFGGSGTETAGISSAFIQYDGLGPVHVKLGAFPPPESFEDSTSASDLLFLERAQPTDLARGIAGSDGRDAATVFAYDDDYFAAISYTAGLINDAAVFDEQQAVVGRVAYRLLHTPDVNFAVGADATYVLKVADTAAGPNSPTAFRLRERPELNIDSTSTRLIDTNTIDAADALEWGVEATGNWHSFYAQGGYFGFDVGRRASALADPSFDGWYLQASWILTGETKPYRPERGAYSLPKPTDPFSFSKPGIGAWEIAARYSDLDLDYQPGLAGAAKPAAGIRGGDQKIWTVGLNWYPNNAIRFVLDYQHTDVDRLNNAGGGIGAKLDAVSLRAQLSL